MTKIIPIKIANTSADNIRKVPTVQGKNNVIGISVIFSRECNLHCDFCLEHHYNEDNPENRYIHIPEQLSADVIQQCLTNTMNVLESFKRYDNFSLSLLGGELFQDKYSDDIWKEFDNFLNTISTTLGNWGKKFNITLMTNLITKHPERIVKLAKKFSCVINMSWDVAGRFQTNAVYDLWLRNAMYVKRSETPYVVNIVRSRPNIESVLNNDPRWVDIYSNFETWFEEYQDVGDSTYSVDQQLLYEFYTTLYNKYPQTGNIQELCDKRIGKHYQTCTTVFPGTVSWECCDHFAAMKNMYDTKGCLFCDYYVCCPLHDCFMCAFSDQQQCYMKRFLQRIDFR